MSDKNPKISVLMSVYNGSLYLKESIESILNQSFADFEFIIINDSSTDNSERIIAEYAKQDRRVKLLNNPANIGLTKSLNIALNLARGKYIARQDADDISLPHRFAKQILVLDRQPQVSLVSCDLEIIDAKGNLITKEKRSCDSMWIPWYLMFYNYIGGHSQVIFRKDKALSLGGYCEDYTYSQDYEFWCRLIEVGDMVILPEILLKRREHKQGITYRKRSQQLEYALQVSRRNLKYSIGEELSYEELLDLKYFWSGHILGRFPDIKKLEYINSKQKQISQAFSARNAIAGKNNLYTNKQLKQLIGKQFTWWVWSLSAIRCFPSRIKISYCAFDWYSKEIIGFWLKEIYARPILVLRRLTAKIYKKLRRD